ncbi:recombinase family protein [Amycolatopsis eburnea]|uniref:Recombinase family protein n=1 Tax=Amycolatopsis eburnea TaxID=2267691 RepID=A0A427TQ61_9PSEU|nr:recombinase family protein [Amycolatopsis eburnea]
MELGYARVSTKKQDLTRQLDALAAAGIPDERIFVDKRTGANTERDGWKRLLAYVRPGDTITASNLDRLGRNMRECLNIVHDLTEEDIGVRTLSDPFPIDTRDDSPMAQIAVAMLALFAQMERTFMLERAAGARAALEARGGSPGRPRKLSDDALRAAKAAVNSGMDVDAVAKLHGVSRATLYRYLAELEAEQLLAEAATLDDDQDHDPDGERRTA